MGKKKVRKTYKSSGMHSNVAKSTLRLAREGVPLIERELNKVEAWLQGKNPWITVENNQRGTNRPFYKVRANELYGNPKNATYSIFRGKE
jgi:hypothetical protein